MNYLTYSEKKNFQGCRSTDKSVVALCFSTECASYNIYRPIRYCRQCHNSRHNNKRGGDHIIHTCLPNAWEMNPEMQTYLVESIVRYVVSSLLFLCFRLI